MHPHSLVCRFHVDPKEALDAFVDPRAHWMLPVHFDTFVNSLDEFGEAPRTLRRLLPEYELDERRVAILRHSEQRVFVPR